MAFGWYHFMYLDVDGVEYIDICDHDFLALFNLFARDEGLGSRLCLIPVKRIRGAAVVEPTSP